MDISQIPIRLEALHTVALASFTVSGRLTEANARFCQLINVDQQAFKGARVDHQFISPGFSSLINYPADNEGKIYHGLLTFGEINGQVRSLQTCIWRESEQLTLLAEYNVIQLEQLNDRVLKLNQDYVKSQFEITQVNLKLKQREQQLEASIAELKQTQDQLIEAEKMAALGMLVAGVAHEINTPLGISMGSASLLSKQLHELKQHYSKQQIISLELNSFFKKSEPATELIFSNLERIARLTDTLRKTAVDNHALPKVSLNLKNCLDNVLASYKDLLVDKGIKVNVSCHSNLQINSWVMDWSSIFTNLIANSVQHAFKERDKGLINIIIMVDDQKIKVDYSDDGIGLSEQVIKNIFDPFFTTDLQYGMGLGMHLVYNIINHKMHGSICCKNASTFGANFLIEIPL